jgi:hypothetical protein
VSKIGRPIKALNRLYNQEANFKEAERASKKVGYWVNRSSAWLSERDLKEVDFASRIGLSPVIAEYTAFQ